MFKRWILTTPDKERASLLAEESGLHPFLAFLMTLRGIDTAELAADFLGLTDQTEDPFSLIDMDVAVDRVQRAIDDHEKIAIFGDYDADGVTATALVYLYLQSRGADVEYRIPTRQGEGYGLNEPSIRELKDRGVQLIITVDNGISAIDEVKLAVELGLDVVVTDHHRPQGELPPAVAVVDPHREDCFSEFKGYAGVGVAYKLVSALEGDSDTVLEQYADLIALGTLADVMPLQGENRGLIRKGLQKLNENPNIGLKALSIVAGMDGKRHTAGTTAFTIAPRINAAGRVGNPDISAKLLMCDDEELAVQYAEQLQQWNVERQSMESAILKQLTDQLDRHPERLAARVLVLQGADWHVGVIGIIAARIMERYGKPCIILSVSNGEARGSGRSVAGFSLFEAIAACSDCLEGYGGHEMAAGLSLSASDIPKFRAAINAYAEEQYPEMPVAPLKIDCKLRPSQIDVEKLELLAAMEPFGAGNPAPVFGLYQMRLDNVTPVGGGKHLRLSVSRDNTKLTVMKFQTTPEQFPIECGSLINVVVTIERNELRGVVSPSLIAKDIRYADTDQEAVIRSYALRDDVVAHRALDAETAKEITPTRDDTAAVYRFLRAKGGFCGSIEQLQHLVRQESVTFARLQMILQILQQASLVSICDNGDYLNIQVLPAEGKADLQETDTMKYLVSHSN